MADSLYGKVRERPYLGEAWRHVRRNGLSSKSADTRKAVSRFAERDVRNVERIAEQLQDHSYVFSPARAVAVPRAGKGPRPIVVHHIEDRIVQRSLLMVLLSVPAIKDRVEHPRSFGGIPGLGPPDAIRAVCEAIADGARYHVRSDIQEFFGHIPRPEVLAEVSSLLPDTSLDDFLDEATRVEFENEEELEVRHLLDLFPDDALGVPQGHSLSAMLGNFLLRPFDDVMNAGDCICIRYLDDFLILGNDEVSVYKTYEQAVELLDDLGMSAHDPADSDKASRGSVRTAFDFLGCQISDGFVQPSRENRRKLLARIREKLETSRRAMMGGAFARRDHPKLSLARTLDEVGRSLRAWAETFKFCNAGALLEELDRKIDEMLAEYIGTYADRKDRVNDVRRRRMLGAALLQDVESEPILPLPAQREESDRA